MSAIGTLGEPDHGTGSIFHASGVVRAIDRRPSMVI
jgi:hypothetical protein